MARPGAARAQLAERLNAAYGAGLLSQSTLDYRLDLLLTSRLIDPVVLVGDLGRAVHGPNGIKAGPDAVSTAIRKDETIESGEWLAASALLALDWNGGADLVIGRHIDCDVVLQTTTVSRRHAVLTFRDGGWILRDLESTNGTVVNGVQVDQCHVRPGDFVVLGGHSLTID